jgi:hypothetical protein
MKVAALTLAFNESVNLPIWIEYYGRNVGMNNLFVADRESTDGSTDNLPGINKLTVPRTPFDDRKKADFISSLQNALLSYYDIVISGDCDEILVPNLSKYANLADYLDKREFDYVTSIGLNLLHIMDREPPLDLSKPILSQRGYARFRSPGCKTMLSKVPIRWLAGLHSQNQHPKFDPDLFLFHTKMMDYAIATNRQRINLETPWSEDEVTQKWARHHRYDLAKFVREAFIDPMNVVNQGALLPFEFTEEIAKFNSELIQKDGYFFGPPNMSRYVEVPESLRAAF